MNERESDETINLPSIQDFDLRNHPADQERQKREITREKLALRLLWVIATLPVIVLICLLFGKINVEAAKDLIGATMTPLIGVFATAVGFYFGSEANTK